MSASFDFDHFLASWSSRMLNLTRSASDVESSRVLLDGSRVSPFQKRYFHSVHMLANLV